MCSSHIGLPSVFEKVMLLDRPRECHAEGSKSDKEGEISCDIPCMWHLKSFFTKQKETHRLQNEFMVVRVGMGRHRDSGKFMYTLLYLKWIANKDLLYSTWNSAQCYVPAWWEEGLQGEMDTYICMAGAFLVAQMVKNLPAMRETWVRSLGRENPLEEGMSTPSSILAWGIPMDRGAWLAIVHGVTKSRTQLSD